MQKYFVLFSYLLMSLHSSFCNNDIIIIIITIIYCIVMTEYCSANCSQHVQPIISMNVKVLALGT